MSLNHIVLMGRLTADPEVKTTTNGLAVTSFTVACDRNVGKDREKQSDFIPCVAWRQTAEFIGKYFGKGSLIAVEGALQSRKYTDKEGKNRVSYEVLVDRSHFTGERREAAAPQSANQPSGAPQHGTFDPYVPVDDPGDSPF